MLQRWQQSEQLGGMAEGCHRQIHERSCRGWKRHALGGLCGVRGLLEDWSRLAHEHTESSRDCQSKQHKMKDIRMGTFRGMSALRRTVQSFAEAHGLDAQAALQLGEALDKRDDWEIDTTTAIWHDRASLRP